MAGPLENALAQRAALRQQLRYVEDFIATYREMESGAQPSVRRKTLRSCVRGRPAEAWEHVHKVLAENAGGLMSREQIVSACAANGYPMPGKRPADYVGIILFRNKHAVETVGGRYRLRENKDDAAMQRWLSGLV